MPSHSATQCQQGARAKAVRARAMARSDAAAAQMSMSVGTALRDGNNMALYTFRKYRFRSRESAINKSCGSHKGWPQGTPRTARLHRFDFRVLRSRVMDPVAETQGLAHVLNRTRHKDSHVMKPATLKKVLGYASIR